MMSIPESATLTLENAAECARQYIETIEPYPGGFRGRGIVTCAGGLKYLPAAWVLIKMLRMLGCQLPIQVWYLGDEERDERWISLVKPLGVKCVDAHEVRNTHPHPRWGGWKCKSYAILHSPFREVLFLDADNVPVCDPTYLFDDPRYQSTGALFWPDGIRTSPESDCWQVFGVPYRDELEQESGQILIDKRRCWKAINLCNWYNEHSDFFYRFIYGDKDTFRFAWHRLRQRYAVLDHELTVLPYTLCQHDFEGRLLFQHRCGGKWSLGRNLRIPGFVYEERCLAFVEELRQVWDPLPYLTRGATPADRQRMASLFGRHFDSLRLGNSCWPLSLEKGCTIGRGSRRREFFWWIEGGVLVLAGADGRPSTYLREQANGVWEGHTSSDPPITVRLMPRCVENAGALKSSMPS